MRIGKIPWVSHSNMPILTVDVQPNGYRFVTGGGDYRVCVWNLLPVVSARHEAREHIEKNAEEETKQKPISEGEDRSMEDIEDCKSAYE